MPESTSTPTIRCPLCEKEYDASTMICVECGVNLQTGNVIDTQITRDEEPPPPEPTDPAWVSVVAFLVNLLPGIFRPVVLILSIAVAIVGLTVMVLSPIFMSMGVLVTAIIIGAVGLIVWAQAMAWLVYGELAILTEALAEFDEGQWTRFGLMVMLPLAAWIALMVLESKAMTN